MAAEGLRRMNAVLRRLVADYARRMFGVWVLLFLVQLLQTSTVWALRSGRMPIVGALIGALAYFATCDSPMTVMRTLPIRAREVALFRWCASIGLPAIFICAGVVVAWLSNKSWAPQPPASQMWVPAFASIATLGVLSVLPLPSLSATRSNISVFLAVWSGLALLALGGLPVDSMPDAVPPVLGIGGVLLVAISLVRAASGKITRLSVTVGFEWKLRSRAESGSADASAPSRGWLVLASQLLRTSLILAVSSIFVITLVRWYYPLLNLFLPMIYASVVGVAGAVFARRWLLVIRTLQCLPISDAALALVACLVLTAPAFLTCLAAAAVHSLVPEWGIAMPLYMLPVFALIPALMLPGQAAETGSATASSIQQWTPVMQIAAWPIWTGSLMSMTLTKRMPVWFDVLAIALTVAFAAIAYFMMLWRVRAGFGLERIAEPFAAR